MKYHYLLALSLVASSAAAQTPAPLPGVHGPRGPVGTQEWITCPSSAVKVEPGTDVQTVVSLYPRPSIFCFKPGTYAQQSVRPRDGDAFIGVKGAVFDGEGKTAHAFAGTASNVIIQNLVIKNYTAPPQDAPIAPTGSAWVLKHDEIAYNAGRGVNLSDGMEIGFSFIHHNLQLGFGGGQRDIWIHDSDISNNNYMDAYSPEWEAGGGKFWASTDAVYEFNRAYANHGPGVWDDTNNDRITYRNNLIENNWSGGIAHEVGWTALIHDNFLRNNCSRKYCNGWLWNGEITISASGGVNGSVIEIYNNSIISNWSGAGTDGRSPAHGNALSIVEQKRTDGPSPNGPHLCRNIHVHDNLIDVSSGGGVGAATDFGDVAMFASASNIKFQRNHYRGESRDTFWWNGRRGDLAWFQTQGQELDWLSK